MEPVSLNLALTKKDYVKTLRFQLLRSRRMWLLFIGFFLFGWGLEILMPAGSKIPIGWLIGISLLLVATYFYFVRPLMAVEQARRHGRLGLEATLTLDEEHVFVSSKLGETSREWEAYRGVRETDDYYLLEYTYYPGAAQVIPKRAFESSEQELAFREHLSAHGLLKS